MKSAIKAILPAPVLTRWHKWKVANSWRRFHRDWDQAGAKAALGRVTPVKGKFLVFPADPYGINGSLGDEAMITAALEHFRPLNPDHEVFVLCVQGRAEQAVRDCGYHPIVMPDFEGFAGHIYKIIVQGGFDKIVLLGADVIDGYYNAQYSAKLMAAADIATRAGVSTLILGCSFNRNAAPELASCLARLDPRVTINLRDISSLERIRDFAPVHARLVADSAFTLRPGEVDAATSDWIEAEKAAGRQVIGINMHPMLIRHADASQIAHMVGRMASAIASANTQGTFSWLLVPHDYRDDMGDGDGICLRPLLSRLQEIPGIRCRYFEGKHRAATLKALAGKLDGVVTGRMHLAIASLGMGVPVLCLTYQDKFEGLYRHFDLPREHLLPPKTFDAEGALEEGLLRFLSALPDLRQTVVQELPRVKELAQTNFAPAEGVPA